VLHLLPHPNSAPGPPGPGLPGNWRSDCLFPGQAPRPPAPDYQQRRLFHPQPHPPHRRFRADCCQVFLLHCRPAHPRSSGQQPAGPDSPEPLRHSGAPPRLRLPAPR